MKDTRILIVDDSPFQIALLSDVLEEQGFEVVGQAMSLEEVKSEVKRTKPDLVTMDLTIPGTDGFECTKAVHDIDSNIKVIVVSSMMDEELINKAKKLGISGFIQKPVDTEELTLLINRVMADEDLFCELEILYLGAYTEATLNIFNRLTKT
ncbi:response regulator, partial [Clostridium sp. IBUN13A]